MKIEEIIKKELNQIRGDYFEDEYNIHGFDGSTLSELHLNKVVISRDIDGKNIFSISFLGWGIMNEKKVDVEIDIAVEDGERVAYEFFANGKSSVIVTTYRWDNFEFVEEKKINFEVKGWEKMKSIGKYFGEKRTFGINLNEFSEEEKKILKSWVKHVIKKKNINEKCYNFIIVADSFDRNKTINRFSIYYYDGVYSIRLNKIYSGGVYGSNRILEVIYLFIGELGFKDRVDLSNKIYEKAFITF